jgi:hypothetical protein
LTGPASRACDLGWNRPTIQVGPFGRATHDLGGVLKRPLTTEDL